MICNFITFKRNEKYKKIVIYELRYFHSFLEIKKIMNIIEAIQDDETYRKHLMGNKACKCNLVLQ